MFRSLLQQGLLKHFTHGVIFIPLLSWARLRFNYGNIRTHDDNNMFFSFTTSGRTARIILEMKKQSFYLKMWVVFNEHVEITVMPKGVKEYVRKKKCPNLAPKTCSRVWSDIHLIPAKKKTQPKSAPQKL